MVGVPVGHGSLVPPWSVQSSQIPDTFLGTFPRTQPCPVQMGGSRIRRGAFIMMPRTQVVPTGPCGRARPNSPALPGPLWATAVDRFTTRDGVLSLSSRAHK